MKNRTLSTAAVLLTASLGMILGFAVIRYPEALGSEYADIVDGALDEYTPYSEDTQVISSMPYIYIRIEIHKEDGQDKGTLAEADALLNSLSR